MNPRCNAILTLLLLVAFHVVPCKADPEFDGVVGLSPVGTDTYLAVEIGLEEGESLAGLRWLHNDETVAFPRLLLMEGIPGTPPDLSETAMVLLELEGESLAWGEVNLATPVSSTTATIHAVLQFPEGLERTGEGTNGGPGVGYRSTLDGSPAYISPDGSEWIRVHPSIEVAMDPVLAVLKGEAPSLASLRHGGTDEEVGTPPDEAESQGQPLAVDRTPLSVFPNPFNPTAIVRFYLEESDTIKLEVFNSRGQLVRRLAAGGFPQGAHTVKWLGDDERGRSASSGVYFVRLQAGAVEHHLRVALLR